jgi:membrane protein YqaA with SNARE-associated domain
MHAFLEFCASLGWPGLALLAFVAATLVPIGSEWLLLIQLAGARSLREQLFLVSIATVANTLGGVTSYGLGRAGMALSHRDLAQARPRLAAWVGRYGALAGFLGWLPVLGDPCTVLCGILRVPAGWFTLCSLLGRGGRYTVLWLGVWAGGR